MRLHYQAVFSGIEPIGNAYSLRLTHHYCSWFACLQLCIILLAITAILLVGPIQSALLYLDTIEYLYLFIIKKQIISHVADSLCRLCLYYLNAEEPFCSNCCPIIIILCCRAALKYPL
mmetsp:Transcript_30685/g.26207  ORF Transcript_30685/g.26207 Transcript_30685/m.26207 type:complete len:118 (+) Transcript_30685:3-356(+)